MNHPSLIDTGAEISVISENVVKKNPYLNKLKKYSSAVFQANAASVKNPISFEYSTFPKVRIGDLHINGPVTCDFGLKTIDIILGVPFFR